MDKASSLGLRPTLFLSYSHADRPFVQRLATDLTVRGITVWYDKWEITVGDSLQERIQEGITSAAFLGIVLTPDSIGSRWVKEELSAAFARQLEENRVIVLPILLKDCAIPALLKDKAYADFRRDYDEGMNQLSKRLSPPSLASFGRTDDDKFHHDYAFDWGTQGDRRVYHFKITTHSSLLPYSVACEVTTSTNEDLERRLREYDKAGFGWAANKMVCGLLQELITKSGGRLLIKGDTEGVQNFTFQDPKTEAGVVVEIRARRLGPSPDKDLIYDWGPVLKHITDSHIAEIDKATTTSNKQSFFEWIKLHPIPSKT